MKPILTISTLFMTNISLTKYKEYKMVVTLLANAGHVLKDELTYSMLYEMFEKINNDLKGALKDEKEHIIKLFKKCESEELTPEKAMIENSAHVTTFTNTALFYTRQTSTL